MRRFETIQGDCLHKLKEIQDNSIDSLITDPPAGISFMGKDWDSNKGGSKEWISWMSQVMKECLRVLKPGAHGLVWAIPRTSHWTATALEDAGFEIRDVITHLFGSGFPKSLNISRAIDKAAGAEREVIGYKELPGGFNRGILANTNFGREHQNDDGAITAPSTSQAKQWDGWGTALKPASEHWILVRKPCSENTVAANVLKHGTGGIDIDASRISIDSNDPNIRKNPTQSNGLNSIFNIGDVPYGRGPAYKGRFPANLVLSHNLDCKTECTPGCAVAMLDIQSGIQKDRPAKKALSGEGSGDGHAGMFAGSIAKTGYQTEGGASRFFKVFSSSAKAGIDSSCDASIAENHLSLQSLLEDSVLKLAAIEAVLEDKQLKSITTHFTTDIQIKLKSEGAFNTQLIQITVEKFLLELKHIENSNDNLVKHVGLKELTDITMIILNLLTFDGYAESAISLNMPKNLEHGEKDLKSRYLYCAKASKSDKGEGNSHPTVKSTKLMSYLITMITPPNGIVLDPFMGSGSTGVAAIKSGYKFIGIEKENEYFNISNTRIGIFIMSESHK